MDGDGVGDVEPLGQEAVQWEEVVANTLVILPAQSALMPLGRYVVLMHSL